jgi:hypothetical protein
MDAPHPEGRRRVSGELVFIWLALLAATVAYVPFAAMTFWGIVTSPPPPAGPEGISATSGAGYVITDMLGVILLGLGLAYGVYKYHTRDRRLDPVTEEATGALYNAAGAQSPG